MKWHRRDDDYLMLEIPLHRAHTQLAIFAIHLSMGENVHHKILKLGTIKEYVNAVARLTSIHREVDIRYDHVGASKFGKKLTAVYDELKRWEDVPDRREPCTPAMVKEAIAQALKATHDSLIAVLSDWYVLAIFAGLRCGEYAQTEPRRRSPHNPARNRRDDTQAFCLLDITAQTRSGVKLKGAEIISVPLSEIRDIWLTFRTQKNGLNGVKRLFRRSSRPHTHMCFVRTIYRVIERFICLRGATDETTPLSVYRTKSGVVQLLTAADISSHMQKLAIKVHNLDPTKDKDDIRKYSAHSLRVGACVWLHSAGFDPLDIQWILRWESDAYKVYLRNFSGLTRRQNIAYYQHLADTDETTPMPQDFGFN